MGYEPSQAEHAAGFDPVRLIETYQVGVWRYLRAMGCEPSLAEDLTQETFLAILQRPFNDVSHAATSAYLRKTALNMLISHERRAGRVRAVENVELLDQTWIRWAGDDDGEAVLEHLRGCLERLTPRPAWPWKCVSAASKRGPKSPRRWRLPNTAQKPDAASQTAASRMH